MNTPSSFGAYLRKRRKALGEDQRQFAARLGISHEAYGTWERDQREPNPHAIKRLQEELGFGSYREMLREVFGA